VFRHRKLVSLLCIVALLAAAMAPVASGSFCAILVPLAPLFGAVVSTPVERIEPGHPHIPPALVSLPSRAPPTA
jgi:hypothetical protein